MKAIYIIGIISFAVMLITGLFISRSKVRARDIRFEHELLYLTVFVQHSKVNKESFEAIKERMSQIAIYGKPQLRKMMRLRNDFVDKFKKYINDKSN